MERVWLVLEQAYLGEKLAHLGLRYAELESLAELTARLAIGIEILE